MTDKYISANHIEKLGHPITEIRQRALFNIVSKIENGIPFDNDLARTKELCIKLFHWFLFEPCSHENIVFSLLQCLIKSEIGQTVINHYGKQFVLTELDKIERYIEPKYYHYLREMRAILKSQKEVVVPPLESSVPLSYRSDESYKYTPCVGSTASVIEGYIQKEHSEDQRDGKQESPNIYKEEANGESQSTSLLGEHNFIDCLPNYTLKFQPLIESDRHVLESIENSLGNVESSAIMHSCEFFVNVLLHDFPAEIFLQRPKIIYKFQNLIATNISSKITNTILDCLCHFTRSLQVRINYSNDPTMINSKSEILSKLHWNSCSPSHSEENSDRIEMFESKECVRTLIQNQLSTPNYCTLFLITLLKIMNGKEPLTENYTKLNKIGYNASLKLLTELQKLLSLSMKKQIHSTRQTPRTSEVTKLFNEVLLEYGDTLEYFRVESSILEKSLHLRAIYLHILHDITNILETFVPIDMAKAVLPRNLKSALATSLVDLSLNRLYPKTYDVLIKYVESFSYEDEDLRKYKLVKNICNGISATIKLLKDYKSIKFIECLELMQTALPSFSLHLSIELVLLFVNICSDRLVNYFEDSNITLKVEILILNLLSHYSASIQEEMYKICQKKIIDYVSTKNGSARSAIMGSEILFVLSTKVFNEIALFGLTSNNTVIQNCAEDILIYILKCKDLVAEVVWNKIIQCLIPSLPIICCHANRTTSLGRCIINFMDPDTANFNLIPSIVVIKCNIQFLFSKDSYLREEGFSRLCWFMANQDNSRDLLPRLNTLYDKSLANACQISQTIDLNKLRHTEHFYQPSSLQQVLEVLKSKNVEPVIRRSALNQISVMMEDSILHQIFFDLNGVDLLLDIMRSALIERDYGNYPDSIIPIVSIFKNMCLYNSTLREDLSKDINVFYHILRGLFLFFTEERMKQEVTMMLFLLIFKDFLRGSPTKSDFSIPGLIFKNINVPFTCIAHLQSSVYATEDLKESSLLDKWCLNAIQIQWNAETFGGFDKLIEWRNVNYENMGIKMEKILQMDQYSLQLIKTSSIQFCVGNSLISIQNGTSHSIVMEAIDNLALYVSLYYVSKQNFDENIMPSQPWEQSFSKFLKTLPSSSDDATLLRKVITFLSTIIPLYNISNECWIITLLKDPRQVILDILCEDKTKDELVQDFLHLITVCVTQEQKYLDCYSLSKFVQNQVESWEHVIKTLAENLRSNNSQHFYKLAYLDTLLLCLVHLTATLGWSNSKPGAQPKGVLVQLIAELCEMVDTFHYGKGNSASASVMGLSITRNIVLILNHLLAELQFCKVKNWELCFLEEDSALKKYLALWTSRDVVLRAGALQLFSGFLSSLRAALKIIDRAKIENSNIWELVMTILIDHHEASIVREYAAQILSNLTYQIYPNTNSKNIKTGNAVELINLLEEYDFYNNLQNMLNSLFILNFSKNENGQSDLKYFKDSDSEHTSNEINDIATAGLIKHTLLFLYNVISIAQDVIISKLNEQGLVKLIFRVLCNPSISIDDTNQLSLYCDILEMNTSVCMVLKKLSEVNSTCIGSILHTDDCFNTLFSLLNAKLYYTHLPELLYLRNKLWSVIFLLLTNIIEFIYSCEGKSDILLTEINEIFFRTVTDIGSDIFFDAIVESLCSMGSEGIHIVQNNSSIEGKIWEDKHLASRLNDIEAVVPFGYLSLNDCIEQNILLPLVNDIDFFNIRIFLELQNSSVQFLSCLMKIEIYRLFNTERNGTNTFRYILDNVKISRSIDISPNEKTENHDPNKLLKSNNNKIEQKSHMFKMSLLEEIYFGSLMKTKKTDSLDNIEINLTRNNNGIGVAAEMCKILLHLYDICNVQMLKYKTYVKKKSLVISALSGLLCISREAKEYALNCNLMAVIIKQLKERHTLLSLESVDCLRRVQDKKRIHPMLNEINSLIGLLTNFMVDNENVKSSAAGLNLADVVHKLWIWFLVQNTYIVDILKLLSVFTTDCTKACQTIPLTSPIVGTGPRKTPNNMSLLHAIISLITREMDQMSKIRSLSSLTLSFNILQNCCKMLESRVLLSKSNLFESISRLHPVLTKRQKPWDDVEMLWLEFLQTFTNYPEGQTMVVKNSEAFEFVLTSSCGPRLANKETAMMVLRNISFYQPNKSKLLMSNEFLSTLKSKLQNGTYDEKKLTIIIVWSLSANCQKAKLVFKSMKLDIEIENVLRQHQLMKEASKLTQSDTEYIQYVLHILRQGDVT